MSSELQKVLPSFSLVKVLLALLSCFATSQSPAQKKLLSIIMRLLKMEVLLLTYRFMSF